VGKIDWGDTEETTRIVFTLVGKNRTDLQIKVVEFLSEESLIK
jgi:hypothetical protein